MQAGGIKVDEHRLISPEDDILRLHIPVDCADGVEDPQGMAHLNDHFFGLLRGKKSALQQKAQGIARDKFLHHQVFAPQARHLKHRGQIGTGVVQ